MSTAVYTVDLRHSNGNMHVGVSGEFNHNTAEAVLELLKNAYTGSGRIFIDTAKIQHIVESSAEYFKTAFARTDVPIVESSAEYFKTAFARTDVPTACLFFKGEKGRSLGPNGSKLIILKEKEKKCCGKCTNCSCKNHASHKGE